MKHVKFIAAIVIMLVIVILVVQNQSAFSTALAFRVDLPGVHWELSNVSVYHVVTVAFLLGILISGLYGMVERFRLKKEVRVLRKASNEKDAELSSLRNLPITTDEVASSPSGEKNGTA